MIIYKVTNLINGKCYVGQTIESLPERKASHLRDAFHANRERSYFHWALREYGKHNFSWEVLCQCETQEELDQKEKHYIRKFKSSKSGYGYNSRPGGQGAPRPSKLGPLLKNRKQGTVLTSRSLASLGYSTKLLNWYVRSNWLEHIGQGAYVVEGDQVDWQGGLYALQTQLDMTVHVGGRTALELQGRSHFVPLGRQKKVILVSDQPEQLPAWFRNHQWEASLEHRCLFLFERVPDEAATKLDCGGFEIVMSSAERAVMEQMHMAKSNDDIEYAYQLMEGLNTLRPNVAQELLENCRSAKVKRLFLWSAETVGHTWFGRLDSARVDFGKGKRQIYKGGQFNHQYQITVQKREELPSV